MTYLTGGRALVEMLHRHGINTLFGLPGYQSDHFFNALYDAKGTPSEIRVLQTRHEQGAAYMAHGYAKATGRVGAFSVVPGPGMLNATAALSTGYATNAKMLCIAGQIPSGLIGRGFGFLHELPDSMGILRGVTKWAMRVEHPTEIPAAVDEAFRQMNTGRPRPVALEVPMDVLAAATEIALTDAPSSYPVQPPDPRAIQQAAELLGKAQHPLILVGSGADDAGPELLALAEMLQAPVIANSSGKGVLSDKHYLSLPGPGGNRLWAQADVVLAVGTRAQQPLQQWGSGALKLIRIDIDPVELRRIMPPTVGLVSDAKASLSALVAAMPAYNSPRASRHGEMMALKEELDEAFSQVQPQYDYVHSIRAALPEDGVYIEDLTQVGYASRYMMSSYGPRRHITSGYQGTLGHGFASALGAKVAQPDKAVLCVNGDGGFMYNVQELATAVQHQIGLVTIVFSDNAFGNVQRMQKQDHGGRVIGSNLHNPEFAKMAETFGATGVLVNGPADLEPALREAFARSGPTIIEVRVGEMSEPWRHILMPKMR